MKKCVLFSFLAVALACSASHASAAAITITFDENGNGTASFPTLHALTSQLVSTDPTGGVAGPILVYRLPFPVVQGDLIMNEPGFSTTVVISDVVRFVDFDEIGFAIFYSDNGDGVDSLADISGLPGNALSNIVTIPEVGPESGPNGAIYTPTSGQPGYISSDFAATYNIISDGDVPEPGSLLLIAAGLSGLGLLKRNRS